MKHDRSTRLPLSFALSLASVISCPVLADDGITPAAPSEIGALLIDNWNKGGCSLTETIRFKLDAQQDIGLLRTWIAWPEGVERVPFSLAGGGRQIRGELGRNSCDTYQQSWCEGVATLDQTLAAGEYVLRSDLTRICQNEISGGNGFIALYAAAPRQPDPTLGAPRQQDGPISNNETDSGDFAAEFSQTRGIITCRPGGVVNAWGTAPPGDVDTVLFGLPEGRDFEFSLRSCSNSGRLKLLDMQGRVLAETGEVSYGYYGWYANGYLQRLERGAYAFSISYPDGSLCEDGNSWIVELRACIISDPAEFLGAADPVPDHSVRDDLNVDDLISDIAAILSAN